MYKGKQVHVRGALENASADKELEKLDLQVEAVLPHRRSSAACNSQHIVPTWHAHSQTRGEETKSVACADVQEKLKSQMPRCRGSGMKRQPCSVVTLMLE